MQVDEQQETAAPQAQQAVLIQGQEPLTVSMLADASPEEQRQMLGVRLLQQVERMYPDLARKITGMLLELNYFEVLRMLADMDSLKSKAS